MCVHVYVRMHVCAFTCVCAYAYIEGEDGGTGKDRKETQTESGV